MLATIISAESARTFLAEEDIIMPEGTAHETLLAMATKVSAAGRSQAAYATFLINATQGQIDPGTITEALRAAFPSAKVGDRHGPHYASLSRVRDDGTRKLKGCRYDVPKQGRTKGPGVAALRAENARLRGILDRIADAKRLKDVTAIMAEYLAD